MQEKIRPSLSLVVGLIVSSILIILVVALCVICAKNPLFWSFLAIPLLSLYFTFGRIALILSYAIIDLHFLFWSFLGLEVATVDAIPKFKIPFILAAYFLILIFKRKSNFVIHVHR